MKTLIKTLAVAAAVALALKTRVIFIKHKDEPEPIIPTTPKPIWPQWSELTQDQKEEICRAMDDLLAGESDFSTALYIIERIFKENQNG